MRPRVSRGDFVQTVVDEIGLTRRDGEAIYDRMMELMKASVLSGRSVVLRGLGVFEVRVRKSGFRRKHPTIRRVEFVPGQTLMERLASGRVFARGQLSGSRRKAIRIAEGRAPKPPSGWWLNYQLRRAENAAKFLDGGGQGGDVGVEKGQLGGQE